MATMANGRVSPVSLLLGHNFTLLALNSIIVHVCFFFFSFQTKDSPSHSNPPVSPGIFSEELQNKIEENARLHRQVLNNVTLVSNSPEQVIFFFSRRRWLEIFFLLFQELKRSLTFYFSSEECKYWYIVN